MAVYDNLLSERMLRVANMATPGLKIADIGCDHAFVSLYLAENKIAPYVVAMDVREGPLQIARRNVGAKKNIDVRLSDGFSSLKSGETEGAIIAGMGGPLICKILDEGRYILTEGYELVLQPQSEIEEVRQYLWDNGFIIVDEDMLIDEGKYYTIIKARKVINQKQTGNQSVIFKRFGEILLRKNNPILKKYLDKELALKNDIKRKLLSETERAKSDEAVARIELRIKEIDDELECIEKALSSYYR